MGTFGYTVFNVLFYVAAHHTSAINLGIIQAVMPIFIFLIAFVRFRTPVTPLQVVGVMQLRCSASTLVAARGDWQNLLATQFNEGDLIMIGASLLYAGYAVALRSRPAASALAFFAVMAGRRVRHVDSIRDLRMARRRSDLARPAPAGGLIVAIALLPSLLSQLLFMRGVELIGPGRAGLFVNLTPVLAAALAVLLLGEQFHWYHAAALALVFGGIWLSERGSHA